MKNSDSPVDSATGSRLLSSAQETVSDLRIGSMQILLRQNFIVLISISKFFLVFRKIKRLSFFFKNSRNIKKGRLI